MDPKMLVLRRHRDEEVIINVPGRPPIVVRVMEVGEKTVRLGFEAEEEIRIYRREIQEEIDKDLDSQRR